MGRTRSGRLSAGLTRLWPRWHVALLDVAVWLATTALVLVAHEPVAEWLLVAAPVAVAGGVVVARGWPLVGLAAGTALATVDARCLAVLVLAGYLAGRRLAGTRAALVAFAALGVGAGVLAAVVAGSGWGWLTGTLLVLFAGVVPWLVGRYRRQYQDLVHAGWERAELLERAQRSIADQARLRERARIAQDMHDSLGHELSLIALRAGALEVAPDHAECCRSAAGDLRVSATRATERLREIIGVLREPESESGVDAAPRQPAGESIAELVARARASGMAVELHQDGPDPALPLMVDRAAYRVVQEALTNATKHAPGAPVSVRLTHAAEHTEVRVSNPTPPRVGPLSGLPGGQRGLIGLRERVRLVGGGFEAGPDTTGSGFAVRARLPHRATAPRPAEHTAGPAGPDSESGRQLAHSRRRVRRSLVALVAAPAAVLGGIAVLTTAILVTDRVSSRLPPSDYDRIQVGQHRAEIEPLLPGQERTERPRVVEPPVPAGASCVYYGTSGNPFDLPSDVYRLCFADGVLVAKDLVPGDGPRLRGDSE